MSEETPGATGSQTPVSGTTPTVDAAAIKAMSFEDALAELRRIVEELEQGKGKLDEAIEAYERGALLKAHCEQKLREAEAKIERIAVGNDGSVSTTPFDPA